MRLYHNNNKPSAPANQSEPQLLADDAAAKVLALENMTIELVTKPKRAY